MSAKGAKGAKAESPRARAEELRRVIAGHDHRYYVLDDPTIADDDYDALIDELRAIEAEHPDLVTPDSPTQRITGEPISSLEKVEHLLPMLSLANARSEEEIRAWVQRMRVHLAREGIEDPDFDYVCEPKIDGLAMSLALRGRRLRSRRHPRRRRRSARTSPTTCAPIPAIPLRTEGAPRLLEVRGEVYMSLADFAALNDAARRGRAVDLHEPAQRRRGDHPPARPQARPASAPCRCGRYGIGAREGLVDCRSTGSRWSGCASTASASTPTSCA